jgi:Tfp pilus assembly protein PilO
MSDTASVVLSMLRAIRGDLATVKDRIDDMARRMTALETEVRQGVASVQLSIAHQSLRLDAFEQRMGRIETRLELTDVEG